MINFLWLDGFQIYVYINTLRCTCIYICICDSMMWKVWHMGNSYVFVFQSFNKYESKWIISVRRNNNLKPPPSIADHQQYSTCSPEDSFETSSSSPKEKHGAPQNSKGKGPYMAFFSKQHLRIGICAVTEQGLRNADGILLSALGFYLHGDFQICKPFLR